MTTKEAIRIIERRRDYLAKRLAAEDKTRPPLRLDRAEFSALALALELLEQAHHDNYVDGKEGFN